ncbi:MATH domain and coiled-coil domain-containing protein At3g58370-like isoform X2 [Cornus florida]|uniref:MATH domain and coiled-coil domain-containing protein At3g58370-like isoform X2 n=1 Tax=Cornus florida TaxID=4283 RepID=UPI0028A09B2B|nr:MATH domain and coiled-coil domain-containing protein At3g58370-like isoform X2 [Cornus florida]
MVVLIFVCLESAVEVKRTLRDVQPSHYIFKIESFSLLLETKTENYESDVFEAGGYKWTLSFYPNGNRKRNKKDHIALYLAISDTDNLPCDWEVHVNFKLFVYDHIRDKYLTVEDTEPARRFHVMKTEWGFEKFLSLETFQNPSNGYLIDDNCVFGAEVFVMKFAGKGECLSMTKELSDNIYTWKVDNFSASSQEYFSDEFNIGGRNWKLSLYPKGDVKVKDEKSLSLFLEVADYEKLSLKPKLYAKYKLRIKDQVNVSVWFGAMRRSWGRPSFMPLSDLYVKSKGFMVNDTTIIEAEIAILSVTKNFP